LPVDLFLATLKRVLISILVRLLSLPAAVHDILVPLLKSVAILLIVPFDIFRSKTIAFVSFHTRAIYAYSIPRELCMTGTA
jgi:hypothetical protein